MEVAELKRLSSLVIADDVCGDAHVDFGGIEEGEITGGRAVDGSGKERDVKGIVGREVLSDGVHPPMPVVDHSDPHREIVGIDAAHDVKAS